MNRHYFISSALLFLVTSGCVESPEDAALDVERLCSLSAIAYKAQDFGSITTELERQFGLARTKIRVTPEGVFAPLKERFVEESGYFVARPGVDLKTKGTDPSFEPISGCVYRYKIKG